MSHVIVVWQNSQLSGLPQRILAHGGRGAFLHGAQVPQLSHVIVVFVHGREFPAAPPRALTSGASSANAGLAIAQWRWQLMRLGVCAVLHQKSESRARLEVEGSRACMLCFKGDSSPSFSLSLSLSHTHTHTPVHHAVFSARHQLRVVQRHAAHLLPPRVDAHPAARTALCVPPTPAPHPGATSCGEKKVRIVAG